jgi:hypothetical protein
MAMADTDGCQYDLAYRGPCGRPTAPGQAFCAEHASLRCVSCGQQAVRQCDYAASYVCCLPLCEVCDGDTVGSHQHGDGRLR